MLLIPHPQFPPSVVSSIECEVWRGGPRWHFRYLVEGASDVVLPDPAERQRGSNLWQSTCFEVFVAGAGHAYREFNFSPSGQWAAYAFTAPRDGMTDADAEVEVWLDGGEAWIAIEAAVLADIEPRAPLGLSAVIEEVDGTKSYWALAHGAGPPDFHNPACFAYHLPPFEPE